VTFKRVPLGCKTVRQSRGSSEIHEMNTTVSLNYTSLE